uniref:Uncharacterized protein n=1 Tax=Ditylenchus dipsaci TaxID=166011 RepID=A0A915EE27_9BILA
MREELRVHKEQSALMIQELHDKNDELMDEVRNRAAEAKHASEEAETLEADLRSVSASYKSQLAELQEITDDNQKFVEDLEQSKRISQVYKAADAQLKSCKGSSDHYKNKLANSESRFSEPRVERSETRERCLEGGKSQLSIEMEGLKTHADLLSTQMNEIQQKKASALRVRLFKQQQ